MGTNYYCRGLHLGKQSCGWIFNFHGIPEKGLISLESWKKFVGRRVIRSTSGHRLTWKQFAERVLSRTGDNEFDFFRYRALDCHPDNEWQYTMKRTVVPGVDQAVVYTQRRRDRDRGVEVQLWKDPVTGHMFMTGDWS